MNVINRLFALQSPDFRDFNARLIPNIGKDTVIGVKTPELKALAKEMIKSGDANEFLLRLPHKYFEENQLHAFIISEMKDFDCAVTELERFLPYINNWTTTDQLVVKVISASPEKILIFADKWLKSNKTYTVRFAIGIYMRYFLDERFDRKYLDKIAEIKSNEYYINMMSAWYFATALAKQYESTLPLFTEKRLPKWVHNKSISKARESFRVSDEHKTVLKKLVIR